MFLFWNSHQYINNMVRAGDGVHFTRRQIIFVWLKVLLFHCKMYLSNYTSLRYNLICSKIPVTHISSGTSAILLYYHPQLTLKSTSPLVQVHIPGRQHTHTHPHLSIIHQPTHGTKSTPTRCAPIPNQHCWNIVMVMIILQRPKYAFDSWSL